MAKIQIKNSFITSSAQITISSSLVKFSDGISAKNITGSFSGSIPQLSSYFKQGGNSFGTTATLGTNDASALAFETNGSTRMTVDTNGNLGIGTSSPGQKLEVVTVSNTRIRINSTEVVATEYFRSGTGLWLVGSDSSNSFKIARASNFGTNDYLSINSATADVTFFDTALGARMTLNSTGLGIGTTSPKQKLTIVGEISLRNGDGYYWNAYYSSGFKYIGTGYAGYTIVDSTGAYTINTTNSSGTADAVASMVTRLYISSSGYVGIGTTSPTEKLDVRSGAIANGNGTIKTVLSYTTEGLVGTLSNHALLFYSNNTEKARITSAGLVGIGTTSPAAILDVVNTGRIQGILRTQSTPRTTFYDNAFAVSTDGGGATGFIYTSGTGGTFPLDFYGELILQSSPRTGYNNGISLVTGTTSPSVKLRISEVGNVGIGTTSPNELLEVSGTSPIIRVLAISGNSTLRLTDNGVRNWDLKVVDVSDYFEVGGTSATSLVVTGAGNVGIGTTVPAFKLDVSGSVRVYGPTGGVIIRDGTASKGNIRPSVGNGSILISDDSSSQTRGITINNNGGVTISTANASQNIIEGQANGSQVMCLNYNGNIGLGTSSPSAKLQIGTQTYATAPDATYFVAGNDSFSGPGPVGAISGYPTTANKNQVTASLFDVVSGWEAVNGSHAILRASAYNVINSTPAFVVLCNGNVGMGTTSPSSAASFNKVVEAYDATSLSYQVNSGGTYKAEFGISSNGGWLGTSTTHAMRFASNGTERMRISGSGTIQLNTLATYSSLTYEPSIIYTRAGQSGIGGIYFGNSYNSNNNVGMQLRVSNDGTQVQAVTINNQGIVGIGTTSPANSKLHIYADHVSGHSVLKIQTITSIASGGVPSLAFFDSDGTRNTLVYAASDGTYLANEVNKPIIFSTNSTQKMTIASTGLVGIGTTVPASLLHVYSTSSEPAIRLTSTSGSAKTYGLVCNTAWAPGSFHIYDYTADVTRIHISSGGNVGIGVGATSPATKLYVVSSGSPIARFDGSSVASSGATEIDVLGPQSNGDLNLGIGGSTFNEAANNIQNKGYITTGTGLTGLNLRSDAGYVQITTGGTASSNERMRITSDGKVGIGTSSPVTKLQVSGSATIGGYNAFYSGTGVTSLSITAPLYPVLAFYYGTTLAGTVGGYSDHMSIYAPASKYISFEPGDSEKMRIKADGNVGIGTTTPAYTLEVASGTSGQQPLVNFRTADSTAANNAGIQIFATPSATASSRLVQMVWDADGANSAGVDYFLINKIGNNGEVQLLQYSNAAMRFGTNFGGRATYDMTIGTTGNVGIGTTSPTSKLHIVGDSIFNGQISSTGAMAIGMTPAPFWNARFTDYSDGSGVYIGSVQAGGYKYISGESYYNNSSFWQSNKTTSTAIGLGDGILRFYTDSGLTANTNFIPSERMRITVGGNVGIGTTSPAVKLDVVGDIRTSTGILFGTDTAAANLLDDYEEGTWTPVYSSTTGAFTTMPSVGAGKYRKIGDTVFFWIDLRTVGTVALGTASGDIRITGFPFTCSSAGGYGTITIFQQFNLAVSFTYLGIIITESTTIARITKNSSNSSVAYVQANELSTATGNFENLFGAFGMYNV